MTSDHLILVRRLRSVLGAVEELSDTDRDSISVLITAGEWALALETLCTQVFEYDIELAASVREELSRLGNELGVMTGYFLGDPWVDLGGSTGDSADSG